VQPRADIGTSLDPSFDDAEPLLLALLADDVGTGPGLAPTLLAFAGDRPLGLIRLRPHGSGEIVDVLVEILALLLPLGMDRAALALPGRAWSLDGTDGVPWEAGSSARHELMADDASDRRTGGPSAHRAPTPQDGPAAHDQDLRHPVAVVVLADASTGACEVRSRIHPLRFDPDGSCTWLPVVEPDGPVEAPAVAALQVLLDRRADLAAKAGQELGIAAQFGRVLLLGHEISLAPLTTRRLLAATTASG
jgi:hypothetical protein